jgi:iron complex transport system ATP-binding protein
MTSIEVRAVSFRIGGVPLVSDVSFEARPGDLVAIVGANGAGKSTLLRLLSGDLHPTSGDVRIDGRSIRGVRAAELARLRAVLPQRSTIEFAFTVRDVVAMGRSPQLQRGRRTSTDDLLVDEAMAAAFVSHLSGRAFPSLSGGEQARACFARVIAQDTPIVLLDEPTAALDIRHQHTILGKARELADSGRTVVAVLHDLNLAAGYATRIVAMRRAAIVAAGRPAEVLTPRILSTVYGHPVEVMTVGDPPRLVTVPAVV